MTLVPTTRLPLVLALAAVALPSTGVLVADGGMFHDAQFEAEISLSWPAAMPPYVGTPMYKPSMLIVRYAFMRPDKVKMTLVSAFPRNAVTPFAHREGATYVFGPGRVDFLEPSFREWRSGSIGQPARTGPLKQQDLGEYRPFLCGFAAGFLGAKGARMTRGSATWDGHACSLITLRFAAPLWCDDAQKVQQVKTWIDSERFIPLRCEWLGPAGEVVRTWSAEKITQAADGKWHVMASKTIVAPGHVRVTEKGSLPAERIGETLSHPPQEVDLPWPGRTIDTVFTLVEGLLLPQSIDIVDDQGTPLIHAEFRNHRVNTGLTEADFAPPK